MNSCTRTGRGTGEVPLDAPAAPEGSGTFRKAGCLGTSKSSRGRTRSSPAGNRHSSTAFARPAPAVAVEKKSIIDQLATLYVRGQTGQKSKSGKGFEGEVEFLYADSAGHVTVGVGHLVAKKSAGEAEVRRALADIPLVHRNPALAGCSGKVHEDHKYAAYKEVRDRYEGQYNKVLMEGVNLAVEASNLDPFSVDSPQAVLEMYGKNPNNPKNKLGSAAFGKADLKNLPSAAMNADLRLAPGGAQKLLSADLEKKYAEALQTFPDLPTLPVRVQLVVVDVFFNGKGIGGKGGWRKFKDAIQHRQWSVAAQYSGAKIDPDRDRWRRRQLEEEATLDKLQRLVDEFGSLNLG